MVSFINKWLTGGFIILPFFISGYNGLRGTDTTSFVAKRAHPFHVSVVEIDHNVNAGSLEISCKIFTDDFEKVLEQNYKAKVDLTNPPNRPAMDSLVKKYIFSHIAIAVDGRGGKLNYVGFEHESEAVYGYVEIGSISPFKKMDITDKLLHDLFTDQVNLIHVIVNGKRQSTKLDYPDSQATFGF